MTPRRRAAILLAAMNRSCRCLSLLACLAVFGCADAKHANDRPAPPPQTEEAMLSQRGKVTLHLKGGREERLDVEIASDDPTRTRGLMFRKALPETAGMIFVFPEESLRSFWMKNTLIPLDMLFVDAKGKVIGIVENAEPRTLTSRSVEGDSKYVLEVAGGWCARHGVAAGDTLALEGMYDLK
jgi:uncharacterized membrane protein (UPF0127 family)